MNDSFQMRAQALCKGTRRGREKKWTDERIEELLHLLEAGGTREDAATKFGCTRATINGVIWNLRKCGKVNPPEGVTGKSVSGPPKIVAIVRA